MPRPPVDIIIPFHGCYEYVARCVGSIISCTPNQDYKIILVDDASPNKTFLQSMTSGRKKTIGVRLDEQVGFGGALAAGYEKGNSPYVVFMHSDAYAVNIYWLGELQRSFVRLSNSGVKLISARTSNPGTASSYDSRLIGLPEDEVIDCVVDCAVPLICAYCPRGLFASIGGFVKAYPYAWYEDEELFHRMRYYGLKQAITNSWVNHEDGGATIRELWRNNPKAKQIMEGNRELCRGDVKIKQTNPNNL